LADRIADSLKREKVTEVLSWQDESGEWGAIFERLEAQGIWILKNDLVRGGERARGPALAGAGLTGAVAGLADAGTLVLPSGAGRPLSASLLPPMHLAVLEERNLYDSLEAWLAADGGRWLSQESAVVLITGPSRTADIEMTLTIGVHGPGRVEVFLVGE
jgi:L-lactate dehydrogenase complex protein LldG